jgi:hypothetical protein
MSTFFRDTMDSSRLVKVIKINNDRSLLCQIYFNERGGLRFAGKVNLPGKLFDAKNPNTHRIGFVSDDR